MAPAFPYEHPIEGINPKKSVNSAHDIVNIDKKIEETCFLLALALIFQRLNLNSKCCSSPTVAKIKPSPNPVIIP
jgi:hypothetical protein